MHENFFTSILILNVTDVNIKRISKIPKVCDHLEVN